MGGGSSTSSIKKVTAKDLSLDQSSFTTIKQSCSASASGTNILQGSNLKIRNTSINQRNILESLCILQTAVKKSRAGELSSNVVESIAQNVQQKGGVPGTNGDSTALQELYNELKYKVDQKTIEDITGDCILKQNVSNIINLTNSSIFDSDINQLNTAFADCLMKNSVVDKVSSNFKEKYKAEMEADILSSGFLALPIGTSGVSGSSVSSLCLLVICCIALFLLSQDSGGTGGGASAGGGGV